MQKNDDSVDLTEMPPDEVDQLERKAAAMTKLQEMKKQNYAFKLIFILLVVLMIIFISDSIITAQGLPTSDLGNSMVDAVKLFVSSLIGYLFANEKK